MAFGVATDALVRIVMGCAPECEFYIAYPLERSASVKMAALTQSLRGSFGDPPYWDLPPSDRGVPPSA